MRLVGVVEIVPEGDQLFACSPVGPCVSVYPISDSLFRAEEDPVATIAFVRSGSDLFLSATSGDLTGDFRKVSRVGKLLEWAIAASSLLLMLSSVLFALVWIPRGLRGRIRDIRELSVRAAPLAAALVFCGAVALIILVFKDFHPAVVGAPNGATVSIWILTWLFAAFAFGSFSYVLLKRRGPRPRVWLHSLLVASANCVIAAYLTYWGVIGLKLWDY